MSITYLELVLILSINFHETEQLCFGYVNHVFRTSSCFFYQISSRSLHSKRFPRFKVPLQFFLPPMSPDLVRIQNKSSETRYPSKNQISLISHAPFVSSKYLIFSVFFRINRPSTTPAPDCQIGKTTISNLTWSGP